jgi:hypothetical protein
MYGLHFVIAGPLWHRIDEGRGERTPLVEVLASVLAAFTLVLCADEVFAKVIAPHFTTVVPGRVGIPGEQGPSCLEEPPAIDRGEANVMRYAPEEAVMNDWIRRDRCLLLITGLAFSAASCGGGKASTTGSGASGAAGGGAHATTSTATGASTSAGSTGSGSVSSGAGGGATTTGSSASGTTTSAASSGGTGGGSPAGLPAGWLYTSGAKIYVSNGMSGGTPWMGRGVNVDDLFFCGYNYGLWMSNPDTTLETVFKGLVTVWKPTFLRISLSMASYKPTTSWLSNPTQYQTPMTNVINGLGQNPNLYVLVTLRSDASMIGQDTADGDPEATGLPSDATTTPSAAMFPTGTDAVYRALVDTFAHASFVLFGLTNEPGGNKLSNAQIAAAMTHAVGVIRDEENKLGVPHHLVSVQGNGWTSDISFYAAAPLPHDNVVYEVHGYPPPASSYTYSNIPVILGEYGSLPAGGEAAFYADVEAKQIPNLAWDFDSYSDCAPDLLQVNQSDTNLVPTAWGNTVKSYLLAH